MLLLGVTFTRAGRALDQRSHGRAGKLLPLLLLLLLLLLVVVVEFCRGGLAAEAAHGTSNHVMLWSCAAVQCAGMFIANHCCCPCRCRGGPWTSDHVDVLGNHGLLDLLLHVATGHGDQVRRRLLQRLPLGG